MTYIFNYLLEYLDYKLVLLILVGAYWVKYNLSEVLATWKLKYKVLTCSIALTVLYHFMLIKAGIFEQKNVANYLISYVFATSVYEIALQPFEAWIRKFFNKADSAIADVSNK